MHKAVPAFAIFQLYFEPVRFKINKENSGVFRRAVSEVYTMLRFEHLVRQLSAYATCYLECEAIRAEDVELAFLRPGEPLLPQKAYLCEIDSALDALRALPGERLNAALLVSNAGRQSVEELAELCAERGCTLVCAGCTLPELSNIVLDTTAYYQRVLERFFQLEAQMPDMQKTVDLIAETTGCSAFLLSPDFRMMNVSGTPEKTPYIRMLLNFEELGEEARGNLLGRDGAVFHCRTYKDSVQRFFSYRILNGDKMVACLLLVDDKHSMHDFEYLLQLSAASISRHLLNKKLESDLGPASFSTVWREIMSETLTTSPEIRERLSALPNPPLNFGRPIVVVFDNGGAVALPYEYIVNRLRRLFPQSNITEYHGEIIILLYHNERVFDLEVDVARVRDILKPFGGFMCMGWGTRDFSQLRPLYLLAKRTIPIAKKIGYAEDIENRFCRFGSYTIYVAIDMFAETFRKEYGEGDLLYLAHPAIVKLWRFDTDNHNNLVDVLYQYLVCDRNIAKTAAAVYMHRNTAYYKLNQIRKIIGMDLEDGRQQFTLLLSCHVVRYYTQYMGQTIRRSAEPKTDT